MVGNFVRQDDNSSLVPNAESQPVPAPTMSFLAWGIPERVEVAKQMKVWVINPHDALPGESWGYTRGLLIAEVLAAGGHKVIWWSGSFAHATKTQRESPCVPGPEFCGNLFVRLLSTPGYQAHVGIGRLLYFAMFAGRLLRASKRIGEKPDVILIMMPAPFVDLVAVQLAKRFKIPLIVEFRDLWPELFARALPKSFQRFSRIVFAPFFAMRRYLFANSQAVCALNRTYLLAAQSELEGDKRKGEREMRIVYNALHIDEVRAWAADESSTDQKSGVLLQKPEGEFWCIHVGTLNANSDVVTVWESSLVIDQAIAEGRIPPMKVIITGDGPLRPLLEAFIKQHAPRSLVYIGVVDPPRLYRYLGLSDVGISAYSAVSTVAMPTKAYDYFAAGLPVVNSLHGEFEDLLRVNQAGLQYTAGDSRSLSDALALFCTDATLRTKAARGSHRLGSEFDVERQYGQYLDLIEGRDRQLTIEVM
jgi:glycosyltransferase involved in cell wall biosynthesis